MFRALQISDYRGFDISRQVLPKERRILIREGDARAGIWREGVRRV